MIEYRSSKRNGQQLLVLDGVRFFRNRKRGTKQYWKCSQYYKNKCPAIIIVDELNNAYQIAHPHSHPTSSSPSAVTLPPSSQGERKRIAPKSQAKPFLVASSSTQSYTIDKSESSRHSDIIIISSEVVDDD